VHGVTERSLCLPCPTVLAPPNWPDCQGARTRSGSASSCSLRCQYGCWQTAILAILTLLLRAWVLRREEVAGSARTITNWRAGNDQRARGKGICHERLLASRGCLAADLETICARRAAEPWAAVFVRHFAPHQTLGAAPWLRSWPDAAGAGIWGRVHPIRLAVSTAATECCRAGASCRKSAQIFASPPHRGHGELCQGRGRDTLRLIRAAWPEGAL